MDSEQIPDLHGWLENSAEKRTIVYKGRTVGLLKFYFKYDWKNPDPRFRKLMQRCMVFYAFGVDVAVKQWVKFCDDGEGEINPVLYTAILMDRINDRWVVGLPGESWDPEVTSDNEEVSGIRITLKTSKGLESVFIKNPDYKK